VKRAIPLVTAALVAANVFAYGLELASIGAGGHPCSAYGLVPARFTATHDMTPMLTSLFLHDPQNLVHLGGNMLCLAVFGALVERELGAVRFLLLYAAAGVAGAMLHVLVNPAAPEPMVGASGAIFGVLAAAAMLRPRTVVFVALFFASNLWYAFFGGAGAVAFGTHIGGFAAGFLVMRTLFVSSLRERTA
jgi:membrane associated rhomboid family serine protease